MQIRLPGKSCTSGNQANRPFEGPGNAVPLSWLVPGRTEFLRRKRVLRRQKGRIPYCFLNCSSSRPLRVFRSDSSSDGQGSVSIRPGIPVFLQS